MWCNKRKTKQQISSPHFVYTCAHCSFYVAVPVWNKNWVWLLKTRYQYYTIILCFMVQIVLVFMLANSLQSTCLLPLYYIWEPLTPLPTSLQSVPINAPVGPQVWSLYEQFSTLEMLMKARRWPFSWKRKVSLGMSQLWCMIKIRTWIRTVLTTGNILEVHFCIVHFIYHIFVITFCTIKNIDYCMSAFLQEENTVLTQMQITIMRCCTKL